MKTIERRKYPRFPVNAPIEAAGPSGEFQQVTLISLSQGGLQLACDRLVIQSLLGAGSKGVPPPHTELAVRLPLGVGSQTDRPLEARCRVAFSRRVAEDEYRMGLQFLDMASDVSGRLARALASIGESG